MNIVSEKLLYSEIHEWQEFNLRESQKYKSSSRHKEIHESSIGYNQFQSETNDFTLSMKLPPET